MRHALPAGLVLLFACLPCPTTASETSPADVLIPVGAAVTDITPDYPIRLGGYASRTTESDGVTAPIHARALAIGGASDHPETHSQPLSVLVTVDNAGIPASIVEAVYEELSQHLPLQRSHFAVSSTHTHSAPCITRLTPLVQLNLSEQEQQHLAQYEQQLHQQLVDVVHAAVRKRQPGRLSLGFGHVDFSRNRRVIKEGRCVGGGVFEEGPVDHRLAILAAHDATGNLIALLTNYACHATTNAGADNKIQGDWPGYAADLMEADHPGAVALVAVGCGADINPIRSGDHDYSAEHGRSFADSVRRVLTGQPGDQETTLQPIDGRLDCQLERLDLPFSPLPSRDEWEEKSQQPGIVGLHARLMLEHLDDGTGIPDHLQDYTVQTWCFGDDLAMVFLAGEVVIDYALRMSDMFDSDRLWINAYCNDVPCYIPSRRILREGGYEAERSLLYFGRPTRLSPEIEDHICWSVQKQLPHHFYSAELQATFPGPKSPAEALTTFTTRSDLKVELVAAEPLIEDPVAYDWDPSGRLWVVEMGDYPLGPVAGRVRILTDEDQDGVYDSAVTFLENIGYPSGICVWRNGAIITAAPDVFYAEDTDGDGMADQRTVLCTGFGEGNQQHRVNGLRWGLDGWVYLANGDSGGGIRVTGKTGPDGSESIDFPEEGISIRHQDLRLKPDEGLLEPLSGQTQFCRSRDDFGQWFGNNNSNPIWHYVIENHYVKRNPHVSIGRALAQVSFSPGAAPVFPTSRTVARFNDFHAANRFTSACGTSLYRDTLLGDDFYGSSLTCEPVHNLVSRLQMSPEDVTYHGERAAEEQESEIMSSSDNWFRPTLMRTGPDGNLYVSDMYRQVIEHPEWIPQTAQRQLNLSGGSDRGRIYRLVPIDPVPATEDRSWFTQPWQEIPLKQLVERLSSPNGWWRDTAQRLLQHRQAEWNQKHLPDLPVDHNNPAVRVQAWCTNAMAKHLTAKQLPVALQDPHPQVVRRLIPLLEEITLPDAELAQLLPQLARHDDPGVRLQLACTVGSLSGDSAATVLGELLVNDADHTWIRKAVLTSLNAHNVVTVFRAVSAQASPDGALVAQLLEQCQRMGQAAAIQQPVVQLLQAAAAEQATVEDLSIAAGISRFVAQDATLSSDNEVTQAIAEARQAAQLRLTSSAATTLLPASLKFLATVGPLPEEVHERLSELISPQEATDVQQAAMQALLATGGEPVVLAQWSSLSPSRRTQALDTMISRPDSVRQLLTAVQESVLGAAEVSAIYRDQLLNHPDDQLRQQATEVLGAPPAGGREQVVQNMLAEVQPLSGDADRGKAVFQKRCATCHRLLEIGNQVGADLAALRDRSTSALVTAILNPNKAVETKFLSYTAVLTDGRTVSGMLQNENAGSVTLIGTDGKPQELVRTQIDELVASRRSFMPEGLEQDLSAQDLSDVISFLQSAGTPWKQFAGNLPQTVTSQEQDHYVLPASAAELYGPSISYDQNDEVIRDWTSQEDKLIWRVKIEHWGTWQVQFEYACDDASAGSQLQAQTRGRMLTARVPGTGSDTTFRRWTAGSLDLPPGNVALTLTVPEEIQNTVFQLKAVHLVPARD